MIKLNNLYITLKIFHRKDDKCIWILLTNVVGILVGINLEKVEIMIVFWENMQLLLSRK